MDSRQMAKGMAEFAQEVTARYHAGEPALDDSEASMRAQLGLTASRVVNDEGGDDRWESCTRCNGSGYWYEYECPACAGQGGFVVG